MKVLLGLERLSPQAARYSLPWMVWWAIACSLVGCNALNMAVFVPLSVTCHTLLVRMFSLRRSHLVKPCQSVTTHWTLLLDANKRSERSKNMEAELSILLGQPSHCQVKRSSDDRFGARRTQGESLRPRSSSTEQKIPEKQSPRRRLREVRQEAAESLPSVCFSSRGCYPTHSPLYE